MSDTDEIIRRFNDAFVHHNPGQLDGLIGEECVMEAIQPAPDGERYEGRTACLAFWQALAGDRTTQFEAEEITVAGDRATIRWRYRYGARAADYVRGVNLMRVRDGNRRSARLQQDAGRGRGAVGYFAGAAVRRMTGRARSVFFW